MFVAVWDYLQQRAAADGSNLKRWKGGKAALRRRDNFAETCKTKPGPETKITFEEEFFLVLVKLKAGRMNKDLAFQFSISISVGLVSEFLVRGYIFLTLNSNCYSKCLPLDSILMTFLKSSNDTVACRLSLTALNCCCRKRVI